MKILPFYNLPENGILFLLIDRGESYDEKNDYLEC